MNCLLCHKPIKLIPSAQERAKNFGGVAADYTAIFTTHPVCELNKRTADTLALCAKLRAEYDAAQVRLPIGGR